MSREFKVRAWIDDENQMYTAEELSRVGANGGRPVCYYKKGSDGHLGYMTEHSGASAAPLMQYTGLKEKNGVEIYEGDIVSCPVLVNQETHGEQINRQVMWKNYQWVFDSRFAFLRVEDALDAEDGIASTTMRVTTLSTSRSSATSTRTLSC